MNLGNPQKLSMSAIFEFLSKDGNITPEKAHKSRQMQFHDKTAYVWGLRYRWDPSLSMNPVRQFAHFMPPWRAPIRLKCARFVQSWGTWKIPVSCVNFSTTKNNAFSCTFLWYNMYTHQVWICSETVDILHIQLNLYKKWPHLLIWMHLRCIILSKNNLNF